MKTMCPPGYCGFVATTRALGAHHGQVHKLPRSHCGENREGIYIYMVMSRNW